MTDVSHEINPNQLYTTVLIKQFAYLGIEDVVICAGSRSTPLTLAFTGSNEFTCYSQVDERSAAYFALGLAKFKRKPVIVVSTSGTAGANFYPAIIEAKESSIPLIICTADRPKELRISGANQTTDQVKLYGDHVNWFVDVATPNKDFSHQLLRYMQHVAAQAFEKSLFPGHGPVHLNFPFRKPLEPSNLDSNQQTIDAYLTRIDFEFNPISIEFGQIQPTTGTLNQLRQIIEKSSLTVILAGPNANEELSVEGLLNLQKSTDALLFLDPLSGYRYLNEISHNLILSYETMLKFAPNHLPPPDLIIQVGHMPISKYLGNWLNSIKTNWLIISPSNQSRDGILKSNIWLKFDPETFIENINEEINLERVNEVKLESWMEMDRIVRQRLEESMKKNIDFEPEIIRTLFANLPESTIFIANSLLPRHLDQFVFDAQHDLSIYSSRGVSGIDGTLSTALGIAVQNKSPTVLITGDLAFYHDLNGLLTMMRYKVPLKIFIINNQGGAIFDRLPISEFNPPFDEFFLTEHQLNFDRIADQYGINYHQLDFTDMKKFDLQNYSTRLDDFYSSKSMILEILVDSKRVEKIRSEIMDYINKMFK